MDDAKLKEAMDHVLKAVHQIKPENHVAAQAVPKFDIEIGPIANEAWFKLLEHALLLGTIAVLTEVSNITDQTFGASTPIVVALAKIAVDYLNTLVTPTPAPSPAPTPVSL
jgi:hypothetical protein